MNIFSDFLTPEQTFLKTVQEIYYKLVVLVVVVVSIVVVAVIVVVVVDSSSSSSSSSCNSSSCTVDAWVNNKKLVPQISCSHSDPEVRWIVT